MDDWDERVRNAAHEIERYLETHPQAADSLEGIATWWVSRQRVRNELTVVRAALGTLAGKGIVSMGEAPGHHGPLYRLNKERH